MRCKIGVIAAWLAVLGMGMTCCVPNLSEAQTTTPQMQLPTDIAALLVPQRVELFFAGLSALENPFSPGERGVTSLANGLVNLGPEAVPAIAHAAEVETRFAKDVALAALGWIATEAAIDILLHTRADRAAPKALAEAYIMGDFAARPGTWRRRPETAASPERIREMLLAALDDEEWFVARNAIRAMGLTRDPMFVEPLATELTSENGAVAVAAAVSLGQICDADAVEPLMDVAANGDGGVREQAILSLGLIGDPRARDLLAAALDDDDKRVRQAACHALGQLWDAQPVPELAKVVVEGDRFGEVYAAAQALAATGGPHAIPALEQALLERADMEEDRSVIAESLASFGQPGIERLLPMLETDDPGLVFAAACGLASVGDLRALAPLMTTRTDGAGSEMKAHAIACVAAVNPVGVAEALSPDNPDVEARRRAASSARMAYMPDGPVQRPESAVLLRAIKGAAAEDPDESVRANAFRALQYFYHSY